MVAHYSRQVNQRHLAAAAILKWEAADRREETPAEPNKERPADGFAKQEPDSCKTAEEQKEQPLEDIGAPGRIR